MTRPTTFGRKCDVGEKSAAFERTPQPIGAAATERQRIRNRLNHHPRESEEMKCTQNVVHRNAEFHYYDLQRNWTRKIVPHLTDKKPNTILVRDFKKYCLEMWNKEFKAGQLPEDIDSCDWRCSSGRRGPLPRYWGYVKHGACHWIVNFALCLASRAEPKTVWRIVTSDKHSTVWDGRSTLFDFNFQALGISANECWQLARYGKNCRILLPRQELVLSDPLPWFRGKRALPINTPVTVDEINRRRAVETRFG